MLDKSSSRAVHGIKSHFSTTKYRKGRSKEARSVGLLSGPVFLIVKNES